MNPQCLPQGTWSTATRNTTDSCLSLKGGPCGIRTRDLHIAGVALSQTELRALELPARNRTCDLLITGEALCQLSYGSKGCLGWDRTSDLPVNSRLLLPLSYQAVRRRWRDSNPSWHIDSVQCCPLHYSATGTPEWTRTTNLRIRHASLCPVELQGPDAGGGIRTHVPQGMSLLSSCTLPPSEGCYAAALF